MTEKDNPMVNNLARVRAREAADRWLESKLGDARPEIVGAMAWDRDGLADIFEAGAAWARGQDAPADLVDAIRDAVLIEDGGGWLKVHGLPDATPLFDVLTAAKAAAVCGVPDEENPEASAEWFAGARWRTDGVADLAAFRITTGDPRFDPAGPVTVNGFLYHPATKEN